MNRRAFVRKTPCQERAASYGMFEPGIQLRRRTAVEKEFHRLFLFAREFAHLQAAGMRRGFPIDVARALERLIGADAVEVVAQPAIMCFDFARDAAEEFLKPRLW